jgi:hypothetical protein
MQRLHIGHVHVIQFLWIAIYIVDSVSFKICQAEFVEAGFDMLSLATRQSVNFQTVTFPFFNQLMPFANWFLIQQINFIHLLYYNLKQIKTVLCRYQPSF